MRERTTVYQTRRVVILLGAIFHRNLDISLITRWHSITSHKDQHPERQQILIVKDVEEHLWKFKVLSGNLSEETLGHKEIISGQSVHRPRIELGTLPHQMRLISVSTWVMLLALIVNKYFKRFCYALYTKPCWVDTLYVLCTSSSAYPLVFRFSFVPRRIILNLL